MHGEIVERAIAGGCLALPVERRFRIGHEILVHLDADMVDRADGPLVDQRADVA